ncbi:patatin-like phospholipase family protein [Gimesia sp.]|uniref:patatin-like phospholipase family protein n=1 Tax=Gimesia sp. TaxID=2024833 RepID=UPI003A8F6263
MGEKVGQGRTTDPDGQKQFHKPLWFDQIFDKELDHIIQRRINAGLLPDPTLSNPPPKEDESKQEVRKSLVGLALSGGGLRAATFSLGILQSLRAQGLLRYFDYITSVSGGGYAAGYLATQVTHEANKKLSVTKQDQTAGKLDDSYHDLDKNGAFATPSTEDAFTTPSTPDQSTNPTDLIEEERFDRRGWLNKNDFLIFSDCGKYLARPWEFTASYILSTLPVLLMFACGLAACASFAAICYRCFDFPAARDYLTIGTRRGGDVQTAFLPTILLAIFWVIIKLASVAADLRSSTASRRTNILAGIFTVCTFWLYMINLNASHWEYLLLFSSMFTFIYLQYRTNFLFDNPILRRINQYPPFRYALPLFSQIHSRLSRNQKIVALAAVSLILSLLIHFLIPNQIKSWYVPSAMQVSGLETCTLSVLTLLAPIGSAISAIALVTMYIRRTKPNFQGARMFQGWNGGSLAFMLLFAGLFLLISYLVLFVGHQEYSVLFERNDTYKDLQVIDLHLITVCAIGVVLFLGIVWYYLGIRKFAEFLFRLTIITIPAGVVICITNGILSLGFLDDLMHTSGLPVMAQESFQQPLMLFVFLATLALTQYKRLLRSQRPDASLGERILLRLVITGVILGIPFLMFGAIAQENFSGYASYRDPHFHESDIAFNNLAEWWNERESEGYSGAEIFPEPVKAVPATAVSESVDSDTVDPAIAEPATDEGADLVSDSENKPESIEKQLSEYLKKDLLINQEMFGAAGWPENSRGWTSGKTGNFARLAIAMGFSTRHRQIRTGYLSTQSADPQKQNETKSTPASPTLKVGIRDLRVEREAIAKELSKRLDSVEMTRLLGEVILIRSAAREKDKPIDLEKARKYLFETALDEMGKIKSLHNEKEQTALRQYFLLATEHLPLSDDLNSKGITLFYVDTPDSKDTSLVKDSFWHRDPDDSKKTRKNTPDQQGLVRLVHFNRLLLERLYPHIFLRSRRVSTPVVVMQDQTDRCYLFIVSSIVFGLLFLLLPMNPLSPMHRFYRSKIRDEFLQPDTNQTDQKAYQMDELANGVKFGGAVHLFVADIRLSVPLPIDGSPENQSYYDKNRRFHHPYIYSPFHIGSPAIGYSKTEDFKDVGVDDAVTISGAAVNPTALATGALRWILTAFNLRLGEWVFNNYPNNPSRMKQHKNLSWPAKWREKFRRTRQRIINQINNTIGPAPHHILAEWTRPWTNEDVSNWEKSSSRKKNGTSINKQDTKPDENLSEPEWWERWTAGSISDGGFIDFLGIDELLRRRCRIVIVVDSSINTGDLEFSVLGEAVRKARLDHGCEILDIDDDKPLDIKRLKRGSDGLTAQHIIMGRILYPTKTTQQKTESNTEVREGLLVYVQMTRTGDENVDVTQFAHAVPSFPDHPTSDQFFDEAMVEAYRNLGRHIGDVICAGVPNHSLLERAKNNTARKFLNTEELTESLIESYRIDCREVRVDRRDDLRHLPMNNSSHAYNSSIDLPDWYPHEVRRLFLKKEISDNAKPLDSNSYYINEERFLRLYESDPNLRFRVQCFVNGVVHGNWNLYQDSLAHYKSFSQGPDASQLSAYVIACHDFNLIQSSSKDLTNSYISIESQAMRVSDGRDLLVGEDRFQAGGRFELINACIAISKSIRELSKMELEGINRIEPTDELYKDVRALRRSATVIADAVFRYRGSEATVMFLEFLHKVLSLDQHQKEQEQFVVTLFLHEVVKARKLIMKVNTVKNQDDDEFDIDWSPWNYQKHKEGN